MTTTGRVDASSQPPALAAADPHGPLIRVVLVISNLEYGGAQRQVVELANHFDPSRVEVHVCSMSSYVPLAQELRIPRHRLHVIEKQSRFDVTVVPRLAGLLKRVRADVVQAFLFDAEIAVRLAGRIAGTRLVAGSERNANYSLKRIQSLAYKFVGSDLIVANSSAGAEFHRRVIGDRRAMYRVIRNAVDLERFTPRSRDEARQRIGLDAADRVVGMFASFKRQKNHPLFFAAAKRLKQRVPHFRMLLVGDELYAGMHGSSEYKARTNALLDELGIRDCCVALGNRDDVDLLYPACDVTVLPSLFEGTPNVALESMACGVPVVATDVSDNAIVVPDGKAGFIVRLDDEDALADRLERLLTDQPLAERMAAEARRWASTEFTPALLAGRTEQAFRDGLASR